jgi:hypothetical protein
MGIFLNFNCSFWVSLPHRSKKIKANISVIKKMQQDAMRYQKNLYINLQKKENEKTNYFTNNISSSS